MKNQYGICEWYLATNGPSAIRTAAKLGFDGIQITDLGGSQLSFPLNDRRIQQMYSEEATKYGIALHAFQSTGLTKQGGIRYPIDSPEGELGILNFKKGLEVCEALNITSYLVASFDNSCFKNDYEMENTIRMLALFTQLAKEKGVVIAYEAFCTTEKLLRILDRVEGLKLCYDTLNPIRFGVGNPPEEIRQIGLERIDHVHVKDAPENMVGCWPLGEGDGKFFETMGVLKELGYSGWYVAENYFYQPPMSQLGAGWDLAKKDLSLLYKLCE
jgi:sugar phosphate isomerase/epimerase